MGPIFKWFVALFVSIFWGVEASETDSEPAALSELKDLCLDECSYPFSCADELVSLCSRITLRHLEYKGVGYDTGYTTLEALLFGPVACCFAWPFVDLRAHVFNNREWAVNAGIGVRFIPCGEKHVYGINTYFDYRSDCDRSCHFTQVGLGFEVLGERMDLRANGYFPLKEKCCVQKCRFFYPDDYFIFQDRFEYPLTGVDAEVGVFLTPRCCDYRFYAAVGPYYYGGSVCREPLGGRLRFLFEICDYFTLEAMVSHDNVFGTRVQGGIGIHFPFCCNPCATSCQRMASQRVVRHDPIVLDESCKWDFNYDDEVR